MATLKITRSNEYANRVRNIKILLNGAEIGTIKNAETKEFPVTPGNHSLQARVDWGTSNIESFSIGDNEIRQFYIDSFARHNPIGIFATIYYITFGSGKYLRIKEITGSKK